MKDRIVIMGVAPCLEEDIGRLVALYLPQTGQTPLSPQGTGQSPLCPPLAGVGGGEGFDFLAVGLDCSDRYLGRIEHAVSYHPKEFGEFKERREKMGGNLDYLTHSHNENGYADMIWPYLPPSGSSAMLGVEAAIGLGYKKIVVAGVLLEDKEYKRFRDGWKIRFDDNPDDFRLEIRMGTYSEKVVGLLKDHKDKVRAMSGYPREILGEPTEEWLNG